MRNSHDAALLAWQDKKAQADAEREAAAKAVEKAEKSTKKAEGEFAKGGVAGVAYGTAAGFAALADMVHYLVRNYKNDPPVLTSMLEEWSQGYLATKDEAFKQGFDFGNVASYFTDPSDLVNVAAVGGVKKVLSKEDELKALVESQARDARAWAKQGGGKPPTAVVDEYKKQGVLPVSEETGEASFEALRPEALGQRNTTGFRSRDAKPVLDEPAAKGATTDRTMTAHTQGQANPQATAGLEPPGAPKMGDVYEDTGKYAAARTTHWERGFDPEGFKAHVSAQLYAKSKDAAKGKHGGDPEFWIYDESKKALVVVKRDKDGSLYVGKPRGRQPDLWKRYTKEDGPNLDGKVMRDPDGNPIPSDKIDMIVPQDAEGEVDRMIYELMMERLEMK